MKAFASHRLAMVIATLAAAVPLATVVTPRAESVTVAPTTDAVRRALARLPYYGVFDFLVFQVDRGAVAVMGYAYRDTLRQDATDALRRIPGVDEIANTIEVLPASPQDDRIRWATFHAIYTDSFLSRYIPGGPMFARYDALSFARFPGMQPFGTYPIHIVVKNGRTMLLGIVNSELDRSLAGVRATEVSGVFAVENDLVVSRN